MPERENERSPASSAPAPHAPDRPLRPWLRARRRGLLSRRLRDLRAALQRAAAAADLRAGVRSLAGPLEPGSVRLDAGDGAGAGYRRFGLGGARAQAHDDRLARGLRAGDPRGVAGARLERAAAPARAHRACAVGSSRRRDGLSRRRDRSGVARARDGALYRGQHPGRDGGPADRVGARRPLQLARRGRRARRRRA